MKSVQLTAQADPSLIQPRYDNVALFAGREVEVLWWL